MPRGRKKSIETSNGVEEFEEPVSPEPIPEVPEGESEKDKLLALYGKLKALGINSISDLEVKIANCRD